MKNYPVTRMGWYKHYAAVHDKTGTEGSLRLATWFLLLYTAFGERDIPERKKKK